MIASAIIFALASPAPQEPVARADSIRSEKLGDEVWIEVTNLHIDSDSIRVKAENAFFRVLGQRGESAEKFQLALAGRWVSPLLSRIGPLVAEKDVLEIRLQGSVLVEGQGETLYCSELNVQVEERVLKIKNADLLLRPGVLPGGWPLRLVAGHLIEKSDGTFHVLNGKITTCDKASPHFSVNVASLAGTVNASGLAWEPEDVHLEFFGAEILPLPSSFFQDWSAEGLAGLHSASISSNSRFGTRLETNWRGRRKDENGTEVFWAFTPSVSSRRGFPLEAQWGVNKPGWSAQIGAFYLEDAAADVHPFAQRINRTGNERWKFNATNEINFQNNWTLEAGLNLQSDLLVDPEFFPRAWRSRHDETSELYLVRKDDSDLFEAHIEAGRFTPFAGFGSTLPGMFEKVPRLRWEAFPSAIGSIPMGLFGGSDGFAPVNFSWGGEMSRFRYRETSLAPVAGQDPLDSLGGLQRDRGRIWAESAIPLRASGFTLRPGIRADGVFWTEEGGDKSEQILLETYFDASTSLVRNYPGGWRHGVQPLIRLRSRQGAEEGVPVHRAIDSWDLLAEGQALELSLRQFWTAPGESSPWLDLDLRVPWYPKPNKPLIDSGYLPNYGDRAGDFGPGELRLWCEPGLAGSSLRGAWINARLRRGDASAGIEEAYFSTGLEPSRNLKTSIAYRGIRNLLGLGVASLDWRIGNEWGLLCRQSFTTEGDPSDFSEIALQYYAHDFRFEAGIHRDEALGRSGLFFNLAPLFLLGPPQFGLE
ncbi:MAG TPA: hypothetical protein DDW23_07680 [Planctomycetes bacterium]|nr:hypothetical protein [Planctomycetota bacterium]